MEIIELSLILFSLTSGFASLAPTRDINPPLNPEIDLLRSKEKVDYKSSQRSYNEESIELRHVNDTLSIYLEELKKKSIIALNIAEYQNFVEFENDILPFLELIDQLKIDFTTKSYQIRYSPSRKEIRVKERDEFRFKSLEGSV